MQHNEPGREPTDAELIRLLALRCTALHDALGDDDDVTGVRAGERAEEYGRAERALIDRGREYLSGARPMPDTPDEVAQEGAWCTDCGRTVFTEAHHNKITALTARVAELEAHSRWVLIRLGTISSVADDGAQVRRECDHIAGAIEHALFAGKEPTDAE